MRLSELYKIMVRKVTFVGFRGAVVPIAPPGLQDMPQHSTSGKKFASERVAAAYIARTAYFIYSAFDCLYKLLLIAATLPVTSASCERIFSKMKLVKTFLRNSMTSERLSSNVLLSIEWIRAEKQSLDGFVDEFDSRHDRIRLH